MATPLNVRVLEALADGPRPLADLRRAVGMPPQTTMRNRLRQLDEMGILERSRQSQFPGAVDCELGSAGRDMVALAKVTANWMRGAPDGGDALDSDLAGGAIRALVEGWSSTIIRAIAARPLSLTEMNRAISAHNYPSLERRLGAMRLAGLVTPQPSSGRGTPYSASPWLRRAVAPLVVAARWERKHIPDRATPLLRIDIEALLLLAVPLLQLPPDATGILRLVAELRNGETGNSELAGVMVDIRDGEIASCIPRLAGSADSSVIGPASTWARALLGHEADRLELSGDVSLAAAVLDRLPGVLLQVGV